MRRVGKKLFEARKLVDRTKDYDLREAIEILKKVSYANFDSSLSVSLKLNLDTKKADQQLRGSVALPNGSGKNTVVLAASDDESIRKSATEAGADIVCDRFQLEEMLAKDKYLFDVIVVEPRMMPLLGKYGKKLGPRGLMPNPKTGTVTPNVSAAILELKKGKAVFKADKEGNVHTLFGKSSMDTEHLVENANAIINAIKRAKPSGAKGVFLQRLRISTTMGPCVNVVHE